MSPAPLRAAAQARAVYALLVAASLVVVLTLVALHAATGSPPAAGAEPPAALLRGVVLVAIVAGTIGLRVIASRLPTPMSEPDEERWWREHLGRAVVLWAAPDGVLTLGAAFFYVTGDRLTLLLAAAWGITMFVVYAPARLTGR